MWVAQYSTPTNKGPNPTSTKQAWSSRSVLREGASTPGVMLQEQPDSTPGVMSQEQPNEDLLEDSDGEADISEVSEASDEETEDDNNETEMHCEQGVGRTVVDTSVKDADVKAVERTVREYNAIRVKTIAVERERFLRCCGCGKQCGKGPDGKKISQRPDLVAGESFSGVSAKP